MTAQVFGYRRTQMALVVAVLFFAALHPFLAWVNMTMGGKQGMQGFQLLLEVIVAGLLGGWLYFNRRAVSLTDSEVSVTRPFHPTLRMRWSDVVRIDYFKRDRAIDIVGAAGKITIGHDIDRFKQLQKALQEKVGERYSVAEQRPSGVIQPRVAAAAWVVGVVGVLLAVMADPLSGWLFREPVRIIVRDPGGAPVAEASITFFSKQRGYYKADLAGAQGVEMHLPQGRYSMNVVSARHGEGSVYVIVESGETKTVDIKLEHPAR